MKTFCYTPGAQSMDEKNRFCSDGRVALRTATPMDAGAVGILLEASYSHLLASRYDRDTLQRVLPYVVKANPKLLASGTYHIAQVQDGVLAGCGGWTREKPGSAEIVDGEAHIRHFAVHPEWIKHGIGTALMARCIAEAKAAGIRTLHCFATLNAESFYRSAGFRTIGNLDVPVGPSVALPSIVMQREIL